MDLSARLQSVAAQVPAGAALADVGTDHAYLPVWLLLNGRISHAIASDLRQGPLQRARETAEQYQVGNLISFRLCNGLEGIAAHEVDTITIAGMGGETIAAILESAPWARDGKLLLLQPMTSFPDLRLWLQENGYHIEKETISREGKRLYTCLTVRAGEMEPLSPAELWVGRDQSDPLRGEFLAHMEEKIRRALSGQMAAATPNQSEIRSLSDVLEGILSMKGVLNT